MPMSLGLPSNVEVASPAVHKNSADGLGLGPGSVANLYKSQCITKPHEPQTIIGFAEAYPQPTTAAAPSRGTVGAGL